MSLWTVISTVISYYVSNGKFKTKTCWVHSLLKSKFKNFNWMNWKKTFKKGNDNSWKQQHSHPYILRYNKDKLTMSCQMDFKNSKINENYTKKLLKSFSQINPIASLLACINTTKHKTYHPLQANCHLWNKTPKPEEVLTHVTLNCLG